MEKVHLPASVARDYPFKLRIRVAGECWATDLRQVSGKGVIIIAPVMRFPPWPLCPDPVDDGSESRSLCGMADIPNAALKVVKHAVHLPRRLAFDHYFVRQCFGLVGVAEIEGCGKQ